MSATTNSVQAVSPQWRNTMIWATLIGVVVLAFDGYDLAMFAAIVPDLLNNPDVIGAAAARVTPVTVGWLGSLVHWGVIVGALFATVVSDIVGRRKLLIAAIIIFSLGMLLTPFMHTASTFGLMRFIVGVGDGIAIGLTGALVADFATPNRKKLVAGIVYSGVPIGLFLASLVAFAFKATVGYTGLFIIGAIPLVLVLPFAIWKLPESITWLASRGKTAQAEAISARTGVPVPHFNAQASRSKEFRAGIAGLFSGPYLLPTILFGFASLILLLVIYDNNTWLPQLFRANGVEQSQTLFYMSTLNFGAVLGCLVGSWFAQRFGTKNTVVVAFALGVIGMFALTAQPSGGLLLLVLFVAGLGTSGTQSLLYALVATFYRTNVKGAGVGWAVGFGRFGGVIGPVLGGYLANQLNSQLTPIFLVFAVITLVGWICVVVVRRGDSDEEDLAMETGTVATTSEGTHA